MLRLLAKREFSQRQVGSLERTFATRLVASSMPGNVPRTAPRLGAAAVLDGFEAACTGRNVPLARVGRLA